MQFKKQSFFQKKIQLDFVPQIVLPVTSELLK